MDNCLIPIVAIFILTLNACSVAPAETPSAASIEPIKSQDSVYYTDMDVEALVQQFPFLSSGEYGTPSPEGALEQLGINFDVLDLVDRRVGSCYDEFKYDLSPSYWLLIDRNVCFGVRIRVKMKDSSG
jgi:hypothetical protein